MKLRPALILLGVAGLCWGARAISVVHGQHVGYVTEEARAPVGPAFPPARPLHPAMLLAPVIGKDDVPVAAFSDTILGVVEFRDVPLYDAMVQLSKQSGLKIVPSADVGAMRISVFLQNVRASEAVAEVARANHLAWGHDPDSGIYRIVAPQKRIFTLRHVQAGNVASAIRDRFGNQVRIGDADQPEAAIHTVAGGGVRNREITLVAVSQANNQIALRSNDLAVLGQIEQLVGKLDVAQAKVRLHVKILAIDLPDAFHSIFDSPQKANRNFSYQLVGADFLGRLQQLQAKNRVTELSHSQQTATDNEPTHFAAGGQGTSLLAAKARITPHIHADGTITLQIHQENARIFRKTDAEPHVDMMSRQERNGTFLVKNGATIAVGGLIDDAKETTANRRGLDLAEFLGTRQGGPNRRELVIVICPVRLEGGGGAPVAPSDHAQPAERQRR